MVDCRPLKYRIPMQILIDFMAPECNIINDILYINHYSIEKILLTDTSRIDTFINTITPYYHKSYLHYINKGFNYTSFSTILRHICKVNQVQYVCKKTYEKSKPFTEFYIDIRLSKLEK